jgi:hypothetical protein
MLLYINTKYHFSKIIIDQIVNFENSLIQEVIQTNCENVNDVIKMISNTNTIENNELFSNIEHFLSKIEENKDIHMSTLVFFVKLCLLYFTGGVIINSNICLKNVKLIYELYETYDMCVIKSCVNENIFSGVMIAKKGSQVLYNVINEFLINPNNDITIATLNAIRNDENCKILNEKIIGDKSNTYYMENVILEHYYSEILILEKCRIKIPVQKDRLKIGITVNVPENLKDFYSNGIQQNCLYLYELLTNIGYDVRLIISDEKNVSVLKSIDFYEFKYLTIDNMFIFNFNLIFSMGVSFPKAINNSLKNIGTRLIYYMCGNNYLIDSEVILYNQHKNRTICYGNDQMYDEIWCIPQMYKQNKHYCEIVQKTKCIQIPFIWSPMSIKFITKILNLSDDLELYYKKKESKIGIFEPNMSVMKWSLPCLLIAENTHRTYNNIRHVYITNLNKSKDSNTNNFNMDQFNNMCRCLDLFKEKKISAESRYVTLDFMRQFCDIAVSHQWENNLNYLYFDLAWMGWPILHNANLCKDVGYYYEEFNYEEGSEKLNHIITNHDANAKEYLVSNRKTIDVYLPSNKALQDKYKNLIEKLFD